jgi:hypothetical protein
MLVALLAVPASSGCYTDPQENVRIVIPADGDTFVQGVDVVVFQAQLATLDRTNPTGVGLTWTSTLDGVINRDDLEFEIAAESLTAGEHLITIQAPARDRAVEHDVRITIQTGAPAR